MSLSRAFESCTLSLTTEDRHGNQTLIHPSPIGTWKTTSFFIDSSGRSTFALPLRLSFTSKENLDTFLDSKCLDPPPENVIPEGNDGNAVSSSNRYSMLGFEVKSYSVDEMKDVVVEEVKIISCAVEDLVVSFDTDITVRASNHHYDADENLGSIEHHHLNVLTNLEITPVLTTNRTANPNSKMVIPDLMALELGAIPDHMHKESSTKVEEVRLTSMALDVTLTHAFTITVKSSPGPSLGSTLVSLTIRHSNSHSEPVTVSNIALHPGHSRYETISHSNRSMPGGQYSVTNMTKSVQWGYAPQTKLALPLVLRPRDAYSTILTVNAGEEMHSRSFISPLSVTGVVGKNTVSNDKSAGLRQRVVVASDTHWNTEIVAVEPADAFRVSMTVKQSEVKLGEPMVVSLRIFNLSLEPRNLMLLMAKDDVKGNTTKDEAINSAVVSEVDGYTFGIWGISGEDDGTVRLVRDNELLAMDAAQLVGEVLGQHAVDAQLRFVPLREGNLKVPNWKLYDKTAGVWYTCTHNLSIVANRA